MSVHREKQKYPHENVEKFARKRKRCFARFSEFIVNIGGDVADGIV